MHKRSMNPITRPTHKTKDRHNSEELKMQMIMILDPGIQNQTKNKKDDLDDDGDIIMNENQQVW